MTTSLDDLRKVGFTDAPTEVYKRLILSIEGLDKTGKTHLALTAPGPIIFFSMDIGTEGVIEKVQAAGKEILVFEFRVPKGSRPDQIECVKLYEDFRAKLEMACKIESGTVIIDTATEAYELARLAKFGKLDQVRPHHYTEVNSEWREKIRWGYDNPKLNMILVHKLKSKWVNDVRTPEMEPAGFGETGYLVQATVRLYRATTLDPNTGQSKVSIQAVIQNSRHNLSVTGAMLPEMMTNFGGILAMVHGSGS